MDFGAVRDNLARVKENIARIQAREGVSQHVTVIGVTKGHPADAIRAAAAAGLEAVGENRVQEGVQKLEEVGRLSLQWHLIGHLQTNKAKHVPGAFDVVHSVDSARVAASLSAAWKRRGEVAGATPLDVLVQVNVAGESQKSGCPPGEVLELAHQVAGDDALRLIGVMTMAPFTEDVAVQRRVFAELRGVGGQLRRDGLEAPHLSMGMSGDYEAAVAEGSTMVRLGTVLFGERA